MFLCLLLLLSIHTCSLISPAVGMRHVYKQFQINYIHNRQGIQVEAFSVNFLKLPNIHKKFFRNPFIQSFSPGVSNTKN